MTSVQFTDGSLFVLLSNCQSSLDPVVCARYRREYSYRINDIAGNLAVIVSSLLKKILLVPSSCCSCPFPALTELFKSFLFAVISVKFSFDSLWSQRGIIRVQTKCFVRIKTLQCIKWFICFVAVDQS